jgi:hypothetical protein
MVEETSAAARSLTTEVESLAELAGTFRTDGGAAHRARPARQQKQVHMVPPVAGAGHEVRWQ